MSIKVVREDYRYVIFRIGKFFRIVGPGLILILPFIDKVVKVNLSEAIPGWQTLSEEQLNEKIKYYVLYKV
jgi:regulator of protease activity HflC (stomatin/prohibitin superfamily)